MSSSPRIGLRLFLSMALAVGCSTGCSTGRAPASSDARPVATTIDIQNLDFNDMTVYVLVNGQRTRLGIAPGNKTTVLTIPRYLLPGTSTLRFVADPIAGNRAPVSEEIEVTPGDELVMVVNPGG